MAMIICQYIIDPYGYPAINRTVTCMSEQFDQALLRNKTEKLCFSRK